jgi:hypothetical protein
MVLPEEQCSSVPNDTAGWAKLVEQLRDASIAAIGIEASGGYERGVMRALLAAGMPVRQVNPFKLRQFARASGVLAKSNPFDARMIASFVAIMPTMSGFQSTDTGRFLTGHMKYHCRPPKCLGRAVRTIDCSKLPKRIRNQPSLWPLISAVMMPEAISSSQYVEIQRALNADKKSDSFTSLEVAPGTFPTTFRENLHHS